MIVKFIKEEFVTLLSFGRQLGLQNVKFISLNDETCLFRPTFIDLNQHELTIWHNKNKNRICQFKGIWYDNKNKWIKITSERYFIWL